MRIRLLTAAVSATLCLSVASFAQDAAEVSNWVAPPYWRPMVQPSTEGGPEGGMLAQAQGMQAQAEALPTSPLPFVAITPCRIVDTRVAVSDGFHQPNFSDNETRTFDFPASPDCLGLPATAGAYSVNIQFRPMTQLAYLTAFPTGTTMPLVSTLAGNPASWTTNAAVVPAGTSGQIDIYCQYAGRVVIDINGYYGPGSVVTTLNTLTGDVTLANGANVTITPSNGTLTIAATGGPGGMLPSGTSGQTLYSNGSVWTASSVLTNDGTNVGVSGNVLLPATTATTGQIQMGGAPMLHRFGVANTFVGELAGNLTMTGGENTAAGHGSLLSLTSGWGNTAVGSLSLVSNTAGYFNTATGDSALWSNTTGCCNTADGAYALSTNTEGQHNTAVGVNVLKNNISGELNTGVGTQSLASNTLGSSNVAVGENSLTRNTTASKNTAVGGSALYTQSYDNAGTPWGSENTAVGYQALYGNQPTDPSNGRFNTALGASSLYSNGWGHDNTANGVQSLYANTTGSYNTASGTGSLFSNTAGNGNTAGGYQSLYSNTGYDNTAGGYESLYSNTTGYGDTASGWGSLHSNTTGFFNTVTGYWSMSANTTGSYNIALGSGAGGTLTTGSYNIDIGNGGMAGEGNTIRIGNDFETRTFIAGIRSRTTGVQDAVPVLVDSAGQLGTVSSSIRFKQDVADMGEATSRLMELRPVTFHYKAHPAGPLQYGLIAEEVEQLMPELVIRDATGQPETVAYHELPAMLLNELQKQQAQIEELQGQVRMLINQVRAGKAGGAGTD